VIQNEAFKKRPLCWSLFFLEKKQMERKRPIGVTIIAILMVIGGVLLLIGGTGFLVIAPLVGQLNISDVSNTSNGSLSVDVNGTNITLPNNALFIFLGGFVVVIGAVLVILGIASLVVAWGLLKGKGWAWIVTIIITIISIVFNIVSIAAGNFGSIVGIIINGVIIYYLYRPNVKSYFGRVKGPTI
jgi:uncharacterized membrane protein (DUF2068 family)